MEQLKTKTILYVEDSEDHREMYTELLEEYFQKFVVAADGLEALKVLDGDLKFDLIISDLRMPNMDGLTLYRKLREAKRNYPFLLATGELIAREEVISQSKDPLFDVAPKPFKIETLLEQAERLINLSSK